MRPIRDVLRSVLGRPTDIDIRSEAPPSYDTLRQRTELLAVENARLQGELKSVKRRWKRWKAVADARIYELEALLEKASRTPTKR
jgi:hypothetical protein